MSITPYFCYRSPNLVSIHTDWYKQVADKDIFLSAVGISLYVLLVSYTPPCFLSASYIFIILYFQSEYQS